jgi:addiction module RelE/StbE family toxin
MIRKYDPEFIKTLKKKDVRIRKSFREKITMFAKDPQDPQLRNHSLQGAYQGYRSIDITNDYRALYTEKNEDDEIIAYFEEIGTHEELYNQK